MKKSNAILLAILTFFAGAFIGILCSPVKGMFGSHNGNTTVHNYYGKREDEGSDDISDLEELDGTED